MYVLNFFFLKLNCIERISSSVCYNFRHPLLRLIIISMMNVDDQNHPFRCKFFFSVIPVSERRKTILFPGQADGIFYGKNSYGFLFVSDVRYQWNSTGHRRGGRGETCGSIARAAPVQRGGGSGRCQLRFRPFPANTLHQPSTASHRNHPPPSYPTAVPVAPQRFYSSHRRRHVHTLDPLISPPCYRRPIIPLLVSLALRPERSQAQTCRWYTIYIF